MLTALGKLPISLEILTRTRIGFTVNALRKSIKEDEATSAVAKELIKRWKKLIDKDTSAAASNGAQSPGVGSPKTPATSTKAAPTNSGSSSTTAKKPVPSRTPSAPVDSSADGVRSKCREMLAASLATPFPDSFAAGDEADIGELGEPERVAQAIEQAIFKEFRNVDNRYKNRIRSRVSNLKDNRNPDLRLNVLKGIIAPERIATMEAVVSPSLLSVLSASSLTRESTGHGE